MTAVAYPATVQPAATDYRPLYGNVMPCDSCLVRTARWTCFGIYFVCDECLV